jgi:phosphate-selective porin OprO/OprP
LIRQLAVIATLLAASFWPAWASAQDITSEIESRLIGLQDSVAALEQRLGSIQPVSAVASIEADSAPSQPNVMSLDSRLKAIEGEFKKQADAAAKKKAEDAEKPTLRWTGRIQADYWAFPQTSAGANAFENGDPNESVADRFLFRRLRIGVQGNIPDNMLYKLEVDFGHANDPQLKDDYIGWEDLPVLQTLLIGNQKRPYGLDSIHSSRYTIFLERPMIIDAFNADYRRFGIASYGVSQDQAFNWRYGVYKSQDIQNVGTVLSTPFVEDYQAELAGRLANTFWYDELSGGRYFAHWGIAGTAASTDPTAPASSTAHFFSRPEARTESRWLDTGVIAGANSYQLMGLEGVFNYGPLHIEAEYQQVWMQRIAVPDVQFSGGYVYVAYFLTGENMVWDRKTGQLGRVQPLTNFFRVRTVDDVIASGWGAWQVAARYSHADLTNLDVRGGIGNEGTVSLIWYFNAHSKLIFNYLFGEIHDRRPVDGLTSANFSILGMRLAVDF